MVCKKSPITAGYRCTVCDEYDICDLCTAKPGRKAVQQIILDRMSDYLHYMETHQTESETALKTLVDHRRRMETNAYATTLDLYNFAESLHAVKDICVHEVFMTRTIKEVHRLRAILSVGKQYSATAMRESLKEGDYTNEEISRLRILLEWSEREKSVVVRTQHFVACPLGHAAYHFTSRPLQYLRRDSTLTLAEKKKGTGRNLAICKVCDRVCTPEGFHCDFCEYDLCTTCAVIWCTQGHAMSMWTVPEASEAHCVLCDAKHLQSGYHCNICNENVCDWSTTKEGRGDIRVVWEKEMKEIMAFMKANKRLSGVAQFYNWRHSNYIVSIGLLCEYVRELRTAKKTAEAQIIQKPIIDKIKEFRAEIARDVAFSATAVRETAKPEHYIFSTKKKAAAEATRLQNILQQGYTLQTVERRNQAGIACPLGHAMSPLDSATLAQPYPPLPPPKIAIAAKMNNRSVRTNSVISDRSSGSVRNLIAPLEEEVSGEGKLEGPNSPGDMSNVLTKEMQDVERTLRDNTSAGSSVHNGVESGSAGGSGIADQIMHRDVDIIFSEKGEVLVPAAESSIKISTSAALSNKKASVPPGPKARSRKNSVQQDDESSLGGDSVLSDDSADHTLRTEQTEQTGRTGQSAQMEGGEEDSSIQGPDLSLAMSDVFSEDEETRLRNQQLPRMCRVCATDRLQAGHYCPLCEYDLCADCSVVYCRLGHALKIWTFPEATTLNCDMCKKQPIQSGYRCVQCDIDVCDMCTTQDSRNAFMLWPRRELGRLMAWLKEQREDSEIADRYLKEQAELPAQKLDSMSILCKKLKEVEAIKVHVDEEIKIRKLRFRAKQYGLRGTDM